MKVRTRVLAAFVLIAVGVLCWAGCTSASGTTTTYVVVSHGWGYGYGPGWGYGWGGGYYPGGSVGVIVGPPVPTPY
jgi:hypothetical protein